MVLIASSVCELQHSLDRFTVKCEAAGVRIITSKSEAMALGRKPVDCPRVGSEFLPQVKEFKYLRVLFTSEGTMEWKIGRRTGAAGEILHLLYRIVVMKRELSQRTKFSISQFSFLT